MAFQFRDAPRNGLSLCFDPPFDARLFFSLISVSVLIVQFACVLNHYRRDSAGRDLAIVFELVGSCIPGLAVCVVLFVTSLIALEATDDRHLSPFIQFKRQSGRPSGLQTGAFSACKESSRPSWRCTARPLLVGLVSHRGIVRKLEKENRIFSVAAREAILATVHHSSTTPSCFLLTSCHVVAVIGHRAIKWQSSSLMAFVFHVRL
jgi:hypothetical protein